MAIRAYGYASLQLSDTCPRYGNESDDPVHFKGAQIAAPAYPNNRAWTIFGGSNEIQRTIIARTVLGL